MSEIAEDCDACNSKGTLVKQVSTMARVVKRAPSAANKPGKLVKQYIEDVKQDIKEEKQRLKTQEHKG
jgi:acyl CoA:acetate/3-ketoacid CoA transferase